jgi:Tfp pilus assembly protein PilF
MDARLARFVKLQPENALANYYYAVSLWRRQRNSENAQQLQQIKSLLNKAIALDPTLGEAYLQLGILFSDQKDLAHAIPAYRKAIEVNPQLEQAHFRLAQAYRQSGEASKAQAELKLYEQISKEKRDEFERQHRELQQFVYRLRDTTSPAP